MNLFFCFRKENETDFRMLNQVRCALALYGIHDKRECAFRIDTKSEIENTANNDEENELLSMSVD